MPVLGINKLIIDSKLRLPRPGQKTLRRQRLLKRITERRFRKIILVCAPAGYGKTTLAAQFLNRIRSANVYYLLEPTDADPAVFLSYLIAGLRRIKPGFGRKTERLAHLFNYPQRFFEIIAGTLANEINAEFKKGLYIVLDDYHALENAPLIDRLVDHLLRHVEPAIRFVIVSRFVPRISLGLWKGRGEVLELTAEHLRFDRREILDLIADAARDRVREEEIDWIESYSEGWPVALRFLQEALKQGEGIAAGREKWGSRAQPDLFQYFAQEIYDREPPALQEFLKRCAIPDWLTPDLCSRITGRTDSAEILSGLVQRNDFLFPYGRNGYRFHNLFRDFLNRKISDTPEERQISRQAADFYRYRKQAEEALKFYFRAGDYETAAGIIESVGPDLIRQGKSGLLSGYLQSLPEKLIRERYRLLLHQSQVHLFAGRSEEAKTACAAALRFLKSKPGRRCEYADALYKLAGLYLNEGNYATAARLFRNALKAGSRKEPHGYAAVLNSYASLLSATGDRNRRRTARYFQIAQRLARRIKNPELEASIMNNWARSEWEGGRIEAAYPKFLRMVELLKDHFTPGCGGGFYNAARFSLLIGDRIEARKILEQGSRTCRPYDDQWSRARINQGYAQFYRDMSDHRKAEDHIEQALEDYRRIGVPGLISAGYVDCARIALDQGRYAEAEKNLASARALKKAVPDVDTISFMSVEAEIKRVQGRYAEAIKVLRGAQIKAQRYKKAVDLMEVTLRLAQARFLKGEVETAVKDLRRAVKLARDCGMAGLITRQWEKEAWLTDLVKSQIHNKPDRSRLFDPLKLPVLTAKFFGSPRLFLNGRLVDDRLWPTSKSKKALFYLILRYPEKTGAEQLIEALWPGSGRTEGQNSLRKAMQHIRQVLSGAGADREIVLSDKGYFSIAPGVVIFRDIDWLAKSAAQTGIAGKHGQSQRRELERTLARIEPGIALGWFDNWAEDLRGVVMKRYETALKLIADHYWSRNKYPEASGYYKKLTAVNPGDESYHRSLMRIASRRRNFREVKRIYDRLVLFLKAEMDSSPQPATKRLYRSLSVPKS